MNITRIAIASCLAALCLVPGGCKRKSTTASETTRLFNRPATVTARAGVDGGDAARAAMIARKQVRHVNKLLSVYDDTSDLSRVNLLGVERAWAVSRDTSRILNLAVAYCDLSDGAFDITIAPLLYSYGFTSDKPPPRQLSDTVLGLELPGVGYKKVEIDKLLIKLNHRQTRIDLMELRYSYAVDLAILRLREMSIENLMIDMGVIARAQGSPAEDEVWKAPLGPWGMVRLDEGQGLTRVNITNDVVTIEGVDYHSFLDPRTGRPSEGTAAVYTLAPSATEAAALARALMVVGSEGAPDLLGRFARCEAMLVPDGEAPVPWVTAGFKERFEPASADAPPPLKLIERIYPEPEVIVRPTREDQPTASESTGTDP